MKKYSEQVAQMTAEDRVVKAKHITKRLTEYILEVIQLHQSNRLVTYTPTLSGQLHKSRAAWAFNNFQRSLHQYEIIRICTFWDKAASNAETIPTVILLVNDTQVIDLLATELRSHWSSQEFRQHNHENASEIQAAIDKSLRQGNIDFGNEQAAQMRDGLLATIQKGNEVSASDTLASIKTLRDRNLAHSLTKTFKERTTEINPMKYGQERELLEITIDVVQKLYLWINGTDFDIADDCMDLAEKRAADFWKNLIFNSN